MISVNNLRKGIVLDLEGTLFSVVDFQHVKPGKGGAFVRTKIKNVRTGQVLDKTFTAGEKVSKASLEEKPMEFLYQEGDLYYFMDPGSYEQIPVAAGVLGDGIKYLKEGMAFQFVSYEDSIISVEPPMFVELTVSQTEPGFKGDTVSGSGKPATLETGAVVQVPFFINEGDKIRIDTRTDEYMERVKEKG